MSIKRALSILAAAIALAAVTFLSISKFQPVGDESTAPAAAALPTLPICTSGTRGDAALQADQ